MNKIVVVGAGGLGREVCDVIESINRAGKQSFQLMGVLDDSPSQTSLSRLAARDIEYLGKVDDWLAGGGDALYSIGIGTPRVRKLIAEKFEKAGHRAATLIHPNAVIGSVCNIGEGSILCSGVQLTTNITIGRHILLNLLVTVGHDSAIGDYTVVNPTANVSGEVCVGAGVLIGTGAQILQGLKVGDGATIGASACVTKDVPENVVAKGVPVRW